MAITIGLNIASIKVQRKLAQSSDRLASIYERLSSGQRINRASDDAAGLSVAATLNSNARVYTQGVRNVSDGVSALNIADQAIGQLGGIVERQRELAEQAANGIYSTAQRTALNTEAQSLALEYDRIVQTTDFNGLRLINGTTNGIVLQAGYGINGALAAQFFASSSTAGSTVDAGTSTNSTLNFNTGGMDLFIAGRFLTGDLNNDGRTDLVALSVMGNSSGDDAQFQMQVFLGKASGGYTVADATATQSFFASGEILSGGSVYGNLSDVFAADGDLDIRARGVIFFDLGTNFNEVETFTNLTIQNGGTFAMDTAFNDAPGNPSDATILDGFGVADFNGDGFMDDLLNYMDGTFAIGITNTTTTAGTSTIDDLTQTSFSLTTQANARTALTTLSAQSDEISQVRGKIGASLSRLSSASNVLQVAATNSSAAESRIMSADMATESAELTRVSILQNAGSAVLAQANLQPTLALQLLRG